MDGTADTAQSWLELVDKFGVSIVMLVVLVGVFITASAYALRRLLSAKDGILTGYATRVENSHERLSESYERLEKTDEEISKLLKAHNVSLKDIEVVLTAADEKIKASEDTHMALLRCADKACDVVEELSVKLEAQPEISPHLTYIRTELRKHTI